MGLELTAFSSSLIQRQAVHEIIKCNDITANFGLALTEQQALALTETRMFALSENGRIEFGGGVIDKLIIAFCDSPYISMQNYTETLHALIELFYYYKNETLDLMTDDDLVRFMKKAFDGVCQGSLDLLAGRELETMARNLRCGRPPYASEERASDEEGEDENGAY